MAGIEEDADISTRERRRELPHLLLHTPLVEVKTHDDVDAERLERPGEIVSIIAGISQGAETARSSSHWRSSSGTSVTSLRKFPAVTAKSNLAPLALS